MSQVSLVEKLLSGSSARKESALIKKLGTEGRSQHAISVFNACSVMTTCHYNVVLDARRLAKSALTVLCLPDVQRFLLFDVSTAEDPLLAVK